MIAGSALFTRNLYKKYLKTTAPDAPDVQLPAISDRRDRVPCCVVMGRAVTRPWILDNHDRSVNEDQG